MDILNLYIIKNMESIYEEEILNIGKLIFNEDDMFLLKRTLTLYLKDLSYIVIDQNKNQMVGFILICKKYTKVYHKFIVKIPNCYEIAFLGIHPSYHGKGLGSQCLKSTLSSIYRLSNRFNAWLIVNDHNIGAIKLYKKIGFIQWKHITEDKYPFYIMGISYRRYIRYILK